MPIPLILGAAAAAAGLIGAGAGIHGGIKMKEAHDTIESAQRRHDRNKRRFKEKQEAATNAMDTLGELELNTLKSFKHKIKSSNTSKILFFTIWTTNVFFFH